MHDRFSIVPASYLYLLREGEAGTEVLLQCRGDRVPYMAGHWAAGAAGHVEKGETAPAAIAREALEELGIEGVRADFLTSMHRRGGEGTDLEVPAIDERVDFFFTARTWSGEPSLQEPDKASAVAWFPLTALPNPMVPHEEHLLELLAAQLSAGIVVPAYVSFGF
jgi:8-oxo-dGTP pyrophosphatase MutT (NUDIX family)